MEPMTEEQLNEWFKTVKYVEHARLEYDSRSNKESALIYEDESGKFYMVEYMNGNVSEEWGEKGYIRGSYLPTEVVKKVTIVEHTEWEAPIHNAPKEPYIVTQKIIEKRKYNPKYGDHKICECGHPYDRHFDGYENMKAVGCKYCDCFDFKEKKCK